MMNNMNEEMKKFVRNYSLQTYNSDYNVICDLTYKYPISKSISRKYVRQLRDYLNKYDIFCDGILVFEYSREMKQLHNHILMYNKNEKFYKVNGMIYNFWKKIGYSTIREYDSSQNYSEYVCKYMDITDNRNWDFISNL